MTQAQMVHSNCRIDHTPEAAVTAGDVIIIGGDVAAIAHRDIAAGELGSLSVEGTYDFVKPTGVTFSAGDNVFWDPTGDPLGGVANSGAVAASGTIQLGFAESDAASGDATVRVVMTVGKVNTETVAGAMTADSITGSDTSLAIIGQSFGDDTTGGAVVISGGSSDAGGGGALSLLGGNGVTVSDGVVNLGTSNTSQINIGADGIPTAIAGPIQTTAGASTAAAGSTTADAGVLPAGTDRFYPTTAADDTKGVRVHATDKVTGREILIGNGVSNKILKVYPPAGGAINGAAADAAYSSASGKGVIIRCLDSTANTWSAWG